MRKLIFFPLAVSAGMTLASGASASAQSPVYRGEVIPASAAPLEGVWQIDLKASGLPGYGASVPALTAEGEAGRRENQSRRKNNDTSFDLTAHCSNPGTPRLMSLPEPIQIVARGDDVTVLFQWNHLYRQIHVDGKAHEVEYPTATGMSVGHWKGSELIVDVAGRNDKTLLDDAIPNSADLKVEERYKVTENGTRLSYTVTLTDPKFLARAWIRHFVFDKVPNGKIGDDSCLDRLLEKQKSVPDGF